MYLDHKTLNQTKTLQTSKIFDNGGSNIREIGGTK